MPGFLIEKATGSRGKRGGFSCYLLPARVPWAPGSEFVKRVFLLLQAPACQADRPFLEGGPATGFPEAIRAETVSVETNLLRG